MHFSIQKYRFHVVVMFFIVSHLVCCLSSATAKDDGKMSGKRPVDIDFQDIITRPASASGQRSPAALKIAVAAMISPKFTYKYYVDLLNLIGEQMQRQVQFVQKKTYAEVNAMLRQDELDLAFICSGPYVSGRRKFGIEILAVPVCNGQKVYYSYFIAQRKSSIQCFSDLRQKIFAFTDPLSNSGYMVPRYYLARQGETPESYFKKIFFTHSHDNSIQAVAAGLADGAAVDSLIFEFMQATTPALTEKVKIIEKSPPYGIPPVVTSPFMKPETKDRMQEIFFSIHKDPKGKAILDKLRIECFVKGDDKDYDTVRDLQVFLESGQS